MPRLKKKEERSAKASLSVGYTGEVTIEKVRGNKVVKKSTIKNTGCIPLFKFFADCLTLYNDSNAERVGLFNNKPQYLNCFYDTTADLSQLTLSSTNQAVRSYMKQASVSVDTNASSMSTLADQVNAEYSVSIRFLIQDNNFKNLNTSGKINILALYSGNNVQTPETPMAFIIIPPAGTSGDDDYIKYVSGTNYIITWTIKIKNQKEN